jgi:hypothetical protein
MSENTPQANDERLRELAVRLLQIPGANDPQLLVGQLPPALPFELPLPGGSRVLGTLVRSSEYMDVVAESNLAADEVANFYRERMQAAGWKETEPLMYPHRGGFVSTMARHRGPQLILCQGASGPALTINASEGKRTQTDLRLNVDLSTENSPCNQQERIRHHPVDLQNLIPALIPPRGSQQQAGGGGGGSNSWQSTAMLNSKSDVATLSSHYAEQLVKGGWTRDDEGHDQRSGWHTWTFEDREHKQWSGVFFMIRNPGEEGRYFLSIRIERIGSGQNTWGGYSYTR